MGSLLHHHHTRSLPSTHQQHTRHQQLLLLPPQPAKPHITTPTQSAASSPTPRQIWNREQVNDDEVVSYKKRCLSFMRVSYNVLKCIILVLIFPVCANSHIFSFVLTCELGAVLCTHIFAGEGILDRSQDSQQFACLHTPFAAHDRCPDKVAKEPEAFCRVICVQVCIYVMLKAKGVTHNDAGLCPSVYQE